MCDDFSCEKHVELDIIKLHQKEKYIMPSLTKSIYRLAIKQTNMQLHPSHGQFTHFIVIPNYQIDPVMSCTEHMIIHPI